MTVGDPNSTRAPRQTYIFISDSHPAVRAFTSDATGSNLPAVYAPWHALNGGNPVTAGSDRDPITLAIQRDGFFLVSARHSMGLGRKPH